jgi:hypothetical protein
MAEDARLSTALPRHPKTVKLYRRLDAAGCWSLVCLFLWTAENRFDGDLTGLTAEDIEIASNWTGPAGLFVGTLAEVRFLEGEEGRYRVHDWAEHNPWAANRGHRIALARAAAHKRWERGENATTTGMPSACAPHEYAMPSTQPNPTPPKHAKSNALCTPTLEQVTAYCRQRRNNVDPQRWFDHYSANGWKIGRNRMRDWEAAVRNWETNGERYESAKRFNRAEQRQADILAARDQARASIMGN